MNVYEAMRVLLADDYEFPPAERRVAVIAAQSVLMGALDAYDALAPTPEMFIRHPWAQWYALDADGVAHYYEVEPQPHDRAFWFCNSGKYTIGQRREIHDHVNWRLCKWQRPAVQP